MHSINFTGKNVSFHGNKWALYQVQKGGYILLGTQESEGGVCA